MTGIRRGRGHIPRWYAPAAALLAAAVLGGCGQDTGGTAGPSGRPAPPATTSSAHRTASPTDTASTSSTSSATPGVLDGVDPAEVGAMDTLLVYCIPGLPGSPREGCSIAMLRKGVAQAIAPAKKAVAADPGGPGQHAVADAVAAVDNGLNGLAACDAWYRRLRADGDCDLAWLTLTSSWRRFTTAVHA